MSEPIRATANTIATIWPILSKSQYGQTTYGPAYNVTCTFEQGSSRQYRDAQGTLYIPASIYWYEFSSVNGVPGLNDKIALGDHLIITDPTTVEGVEVIKNRIRQDNSVLNDIDDIMVMT
jgi:hypothetical protein